MPRGRTPVTVLLSCMLLQFSAVFIPGAFDVDGSALLFESIDARVEVRNTTTTPVVTAPAAVRLQPRVGPAPSRAPLQPQTTPSTVLVRLAGVFGSLPPPHPRRPLQEP
jgi:hypothetical protein